MFDQLRLALQRRLERLTGQSTTHPTPASDPAYANDLRTKGNDLLAEGKLNEAETCFREALGHKADDTRTLVCLGYVLKEQGRLVEARITLKRATHPANTDPEVFEALYLLGEISEMQTDLADAMQYFAAALDVKPDFTRACEDIVRILRAQGRESEVKGFLENQVRACPDNSEFRLMLAKACSEALDFPGTVDHLIAAVALGVNEVSINMMLGAALCRLEREEEARPYFELAEAADPSLAHEIQYHRGYYYSRSANTGAAIDCLEKCIQLRPDYLPAHSLLLFNLSHRAKAVNRSYKEAAQRFAQIVESTHPPLPTVLAEPVDVAAKTLRVGFVAGEFREHPVFFFLVGILEHIDKTRFHLVAYSNNQADDASTEVCKTLFHEWHDTRHMSNAEVTELVRTERIDVLFDLCGHTGDARLPVFAQRPAMVQVTWLGYFASTGMTTMDYILADPACVPEDSGEWFSEKVIYLPDTRLCMTIPRTSRPIPVMQAPCIRKGYVTFGSFQQSFKINAQVLLVWAAVLKSVPQSRLRLQNKAIDIAPVADQIRKDMEQAGIDLSRVDLLGATGWEDYLEAHGEIDIVLDTFPYPGGTTTAFSLWMGVPTVTLAGSTMLSLQGASMLKCVGLTDWIAQDETDYIAVSKRFSNNAHGLDALRQKLRSISENSALFDCKRFAKNLENAICLMYQEKLTATMASQAKHHTSAL